MLKQNKKGDLIVISGPSGCGKGTIAKKLKETNKSVWYSISMTSRSPRPGEENGIDYFFVTREEFENRVKEGKLLEWAEYNGNYYGTPKDKLDEMRNKGYDVFLEIEIQGALQIKELITDALFIFIMPPSMDELYRRLESRGTETKEKVLARFKTAYKEINEVKKYNYVVVNDEVDKAVEKINAILLSEKCRVDRIEEIDMYTTEELLHETLVEMGEK